MLPGTCICTVRLCMLGLGAPSLVPRPHPSRERGSGNFVQECCRKSPDGYSVHISGWARD